MFTQGDAMQALTFKKTITELLKPMGFVRSKNIWYIKTEGVITMLSLEKHPYCNGFWVETGSEIMEDDSGACPKSTDLDIKDMFYFPKQPDKSPLYYQSFKHPPIAQKDPNLDLYNSYIDLDVIPDDMIVEALKYNIDLKLKCFLTRQSLLDTVNGDIYYVKLGRYHKLPKYGVPQELIDKYCLRTRD